MNKKIILKVAYSNYGVCFHVFLPNHLRLRFYKNIQTTEKIAKKGTIFGCVSFKMIKTLQHAFNRMTAIILINL